MVILRMSEIRNMSTDELKAKLDELRYELMLLKAEVKSGARPSNPGKIKEIRRTIARILTALRERGVVVD